MKSSQFLEEGFVEDAHDVHLDHEVQMARADCFHAAEDALALHKLLRSIDEQQGLEGWVAAKLTLASDYLKTVREYLEYELMTSGSGDVEGNESPMTMPETLASPIETVAAPVMPVAEGSDKLQGTPVVSLKDLGDKDTKKDRYSRTVPKKLKKDDPRVKFHKDEKQGVAEGSEFEDAYDKGYSDGYDGKGYNSPFPVGSAQDDEYEDGYSSGRLDYNKMNQDLDEQGVAEGLEEQVYKVLAVDKSNALSKQVKLKVKASSLDEVFERLAINDWYPLEINGVEVINGKRLKQGVAEGSKDSAPKMSKQERKLAQGALKGAKDMSAALGLVRDKDGVLRMPKNKEQGVAEGSDYQSYLDKYSNSKSKKPLMTKTEFDTLQRKKEDDKKYKRVNGVIVGRKGVAEGTSPFGNKVAGPFASEERAKREASRISKELGVKRYVEKTSDGKYIVVKKQGVAEAQVNETSAGSVATVVNPTPKNKAKVGSLFGGTYKQKKVK